MIRGMARKERSGLERFLAMAITLVVGLILGVAGGFYMAFESPAAAGAAVGEAGEAPGDAAADAAGAAANELCIIQLRDGEGRIRADLVNAALTDVDGAKDVALELDGQASARFACPAAKTQAQLLARSAKGEFFFVDGVELDAAQPYLALASGEATDTAAYLAGREQAGIEGDAPAWLSEPPPEDAGQDSGAEGGEEGDAAGEPAGEPHPVEGALNVEIRDLAGNTLKKQDVRDLAKEQSYQYEDCIKAHAADLPRVRHSHFVAVAPSGKVASSLLLQGISPELDACTDTMLARWTFPETESSTFFKLKLVYTPK